MKIHIYIYNLVDIMFEKLSGKIHLYLVKLGTFSKNEMFY